MSFTARAKPIHPPRHDRLPETSFVDFRVERTEPMPSPTDIRPPFTRETALAKVKAAEDAWNNDISIEESERRY